MPIFIVSAGRPADATSGTRAFYCTLETSSRHDPVGGFWSSN